MRKYFENNKKITIFMALFLTFFLVRLAYGYYITPNQIQQRSTRERIESISESFSSAKKNYASEKYSTRNAPSSVVTPLPQGARDQKYEKTAILVTATDAFDKDEERIRQKIESHQGIVQHEQNRGKAESKNRVLQLMIGVRPDAFDEFVKMIQQVGRLESIEVTKTDKTNEFLDLKAQRASLEKARGALNELKSMKGNVDEFINLQYKILEIDRQLQDLGVRLGDYDELNEFCTVRMTLFEEGMYSIYPPSWVIRVMIAFKWAVKYYLASLMAFSFFSLSALIVTVIIEKIKKMRTS